MFWIKGKPGSGKSTLMKCVLEHIRRQPGACTIASFFFNARGEPFERSIEGCYRTLLHQLLTHVPKLRLPATWEKGQDCVNRFDRGGGCTQLLLDRGADINLKDSKGCNIALNGTRRNSPNNKSLSWLIAHGACAGPEQANELLDRATEECVAERIRLSVQLGADPNRNHIYFGTGLHVILTGVSHRRPLCWILEWMSMLWAAITARASSQPRHTGLKSLYGCFWIVGRKCTIVVRGMARLSKPLRLQDIKTSTICFGSQCNNSEKRLHPDFDGNANRLR
jgi:hypothetical protein